jgi:tetratricopeptide (TPR) repeat protein
MSESFDLSAVKAAIAATQFAGHLHHLATTPSTNDVATNLPTTPARANDSTWPNIPQTVRFISEEAQNATYVSGLYPYPRKDYMSDSLLAWSHILQGDGQLGIRLLKEKNAADASIINTVQLGVGYLWCGEYKVASQHFEQAIRESGSVAKYYGMAGTAKWCLNDPMGALRDWRNGLNASNTDGILIDTYIPLLMMATSILDRNYTEKRESLREMVKQAPSGDSEILANIMVSGMPDGELDEGPAVAEEEELSFRKRWLIEFYKAVWESDLRLPVRDDRPDLRLRSLKDTMLRLSDSSMLKLAPTSSALSLLMREELFIARHVASEQFNYSISATPTDGNPWELVRHGDIASGIRMMEEGYKQDPSPSRTRQLGTAYLWAHEYEAALKHFQHAIKTEHSPGEDLYGFAGSALWCLRKYSLAVESWKAGVNAPSATGGVCTRSPMLLLLASILRPGSFSRKRAEDILLRKAENPRVRNWPGTLAQFLAGIIDKARLEASWIGYIGKDVPDVMPEARWLTSFYESVVELDKGQIDSSHFRRLMSSAVDVSHTQWADQRSFVHLIRYPEYFIARQESSLGSDGV